LNGALLMAFLALLVVAPWGYAAIPLLAMGIALLGVFLAPDARARLALLDREDALWLLALVAYALVWLLDVARTAKWPVGEGNQGVALPLWPLLAAVVLVWWRCYPPSALGWRLGLSAGALGAGVIAAYERWILGVARPDNGMNPIPFGNLSLLLGVLALIALLGRLEAPRERRHAGVDGLLGLAALAGLMTSLLSGTRGGWIALPLLAWLIYRTFRHVLPHRRLWLVAGVFGALLAGCVALPQSKVTDRIGLAVDDVHGYFVEGVKGTSLGVRLEMWKAGARLFAEKPLIGWGEGRLERARDALVAEGTVHPGVSRYDQLHSDLIDTAARRGLVGLATLLMLYGVPVLLFSRHLRRCRDPGICALAASGLMVPVAFIDFGMSQSMLRDVRGLSGYLGLSVACWVLLKAAIPPRHPA
jgi:O-antigen ligase